MRRQFVTVAALTLAAALPAWTGCARRSLSPRAAAGPGAEPSCDDQASAAVVCGYQFEGIPTRQLEELLEGRVAGVWVVRLPGGGLSLRIHGPSTIHGSNEPLYVVDGVPVQVTPGRGLDWLNPRDIARVEILKDPGETSVYGMRGANGVVVITTRRGARRPSS